MDPFTYKAGVLYAEGVDVNALAETYGTPLYVYSRTYLRHQYTALADALADVAPLICYSVKANSNVAVIRTFVQQGAGMDIVSGGELFRALRAGAETRKIVFAGVGKTCDEIDYALNEDILFFTVESEPELLRIAERAAALGRTGRVAFRVNPDVDPKTHRHISTGRKENKFGMDIERTMLACETVASLPNMELAGLHMHIGSQILSPAPYVQALDKLEDTCRELTSRFETFRYLDIGGGLGIKYEPDQEPLDPGPFADAVIPRLKALNLSVVLEPGRTLVGNGGLLVCRVQYVKNNAFKNFVVVDAGMSELIRPPLYDGYHEVAAVKQTNDVLFGDVVGPICESGDYIATSRKLPAVAQDDLLAVKSAGAYGFAMASNYNSRPRPAEVMVDGEEAVLIRERETWEDLVNREV